MSNNFIAPKTWFQQVSFDAIDRIRNAIQNKLVARLFADTIYFLFFCNFFMFTSQMGFVWFCFSLMWMLPVANYKWDFFFLFLLLSNSVFFVCEGRIYD